MIDETPLSAQKIKLPDGRDLAITEFGDPVGKPVFFFHGWPGARLQGLSCHEAGLQSGIRIIAVDRPGFGASSFQKNRQILDFPDDIINLADTLQVTTFGVLGLSGGGPYALACAYKYPERLTGTAVVCGVGPSDTESDLAGFMIDHQKMIRLIRKAPWLVHFIYWRNVRHQTRHPEEMMAEFLSQLPQPDQQALSEPQTLEMLNRARADSLSPGIKGHIWEMRLIARPWGFVHQDIKVPVQLWHGAADNVIAPEVGKRADQKLPDSCLTLLANEGHYSLLLNQAPAILPALV